MAKAVLITGATGTQGGAVVNALLDRKEDNFIILAVTRSPTSQQSLELVKKSEKIRLVKGDLDNVPAIFQTAKSVCKEPIWGVYSVQVSMGKGVTVEGEIAQGKALIDESLKQKVSHFVYSSLDRGGEQESWTNETPVPHFQTKYQIEHYLRDTAGDAMGWTILRPVAFMDNLKPDFQTKVFMAALANNLDQKPLQWVAPKDIGIFAALAFTNPKEYDHKAIGIAGDSLNVHGMTETIRKATNQEFGPTFWVFGSLLTTLVGELGKMIQWFGSDGYKVNINEAKSMHPGLMSFETWLREESKFRMQ